MDQEKEEAEGREPRGSRPGGLTRRVWIAVGMALLVWLMLGGAAFLVFG